MLIMVTADYWLLAQDIFGHAEIWYRHLSEESVKKKVACWSIRRNWTGGEEFFILTFTFISTQHFDVKKEFAGQHFDV